MAQSSPEVWVIVPASRPEMVERVKRNFSCQLYGKKRLCVVENGRAIGAYSASGADKILQSEPHQSAAKNTGIASLRKSHPGAYYVAMDDDDYYGPEYILEHVERAQRGRINGKLSAWVKFNDGLVYFGNNWNPGSPVKSLLGATIGCYLADAQEFPVIRAAEENAFCAKAIESGCEVVTVGPRHFCASREGDVSSHTWQGSPEKVWRVSGWAGVRVVGDVRKAIVGEPPLGPAEHYRRAS